MGSDDGGTMKEDMEVLGIQDSNAADSFEKISVALRIVPSQKKEGNLEVLNLQTGTAEKESDYDSSVQGSVTENYFQDDQTDDYFPLLSFSELTVPVGNTKPYCIHIDWSTKAQKHIIDRYIPVKGMPTCKGAANPKVRWNSYDPTTGIDFHPWKQEKKSVDKKEECADDAVFIAAPGSTKGTCYRYLVADAACILIDFSVNIDTASYDWEFLGGCFPNNEVVNFVPAVPGKEYNFEQIPMQIREYKKSLAESVGSVFSLSGLFSLLSVLCLLGAFVVAVLFTIEIFRQKKQIAPKQKENEMKDIGKH